MSTAAATKPVNYAAFFNIPKLCPECGQAIKDGDDGAIQLSTFHAIHQGSAVFDHDCGFRFKLINRTSSTIQAPALPERKWQIQMWDGKKWLDGAPFPDEHNAWKAFEDETDRINRTGKRALRLVDPMGQVKSECIGQNETVPAEQRGRMYV